jgi:hypothetical protein
MPVSRRSRQIERAQQTGRPLGFTDRVSKIAFWKEWLSDDEIKDLRDEFGDIIRYRPNAIAAIKSVPRMNEWLRNTYPKVHAAPEQQLRSRPPDPPRPNRARPGRAPSAQDQQATSTRRIQAAAAEEGEELTWDDIGSQISSEPIAETARQRRERIRGGPNFSDRVSKIEFWKGDMGLSKEEIKDLRSRFGDILRYRPNAIAAIKSVPRMNEWLRNTYPKVHAEPEQQLRSRPIDPPRPEEEPIQADMLLTWDDIGSTIEDSAFSSQTQPIAPLPSVSRTVTTAQRRGLVTSPPLTDYELMRQANIEENKRKLAELEAELRRQENTEENMRRLAELDVPTPPPMAGTGSRSTSDLTGLEQFLGSLDNIMDSMMSDD